MCSCWPVDIVNSVSHVNKLSILYSFLVCLPSFLGFIKRHFCAGTYNQFLCYLCVWPILAVQCHKSLNVWTRFITDLSHLLPSCQPTLGSDFLATWSATAVVSTGVAAAPVLTTAPCGERCGSLVMCLCVCVCTHVCASSAASYQCLGSVMGSVWVEAFLLLVCMYYCM